MIKPAVRFIFSICIVIRLVYTDSITESVMCFFSSLFQSVLAKTCVKLLCEDPAFSEYIKCILMDERTFLNNNMAYSFLTCFLHKVQNEHLTVIFRINLQIWRVGSLFLSVLFLCVIQQTCTLWIINTLEQPFKIEIYYLRNLEK